MPTELMVLADYLEKNPGTIYVNPEGTYMFALVGPEKKLTAIASPVRNLHEATDQEREDLLVQTLRGI